MKSGVKAFKLANGLEVYTMAKSDIPMVTILIAVKNGSFVEDETNNGLAHLYEHMFFKANEKIPSQPEFLRALDEMGIELGPNMNAYTSTESVRYFFTIQTEYLDRGVQFMADALITPKFLQDELEKERKVVIGEFDRYEASPTDVFYQRSMTQRLFTPYFIRKNVIGSRPVINNATQKQMLDIKNRYYIPNNSALFIVGNFDDATLRASLQKYFGNWKPGADPFIVYPVPEHPELEQTKKFIEEAAVQNVNVAMAYHGPKLTIDDTSIIAFDLISHMLGFESSAFQKELVHSNLATSAGMFSWSQRYTSPIYFSFETSPDKSQAAAEKLMELVGRMTKGGFFNEADLQIAKNSLEVHSAYDREIGQKYALALASVWTSTGALDFYENYVENMKKVTMEDIDRALMTYLASKPYVLGALTPKGAARIDIENLKTPIQAAEAFFATNAMGTADNALGTNSLEATPASAPIEEPKIEKPKLKTKSKAKPKAKPKAAKPAAKPVDVAPVPPSETPQGETHP